MSDDTGYQAFNLAGVWRLLVPDGTPSETIMTAGTYIVAAELARSVPVELVEEAAGHLARALVELAQIERERIQGPATT